MKEKALKMRVFLLILVCNLLNLKGIDAILLRHP